MIRHGFEINNYNLSSSIRKIIDDLINLNLNPSTINLITAEFSSTSDEIKENIGRYIANLLEIENFLLEQEYIKNKDANYGLNFKQELNIKNRQTNLLRIQQIFTKKDNNNEIINFLNNQDNNHHHEYLKNYKESMFIKNKKEKNRSSKLEELENKKRRIELAVLEEQEKIKIAQKQYQKAKLDDDEITQEIKLNIIKFANERLREISEAIETYKTVDKIPNKIIDNKILNVKNKEYYYEKSLDEDLLFDDKDISQSLEIDLETFFDVPGFEDDDYEDENEIQEKLENKNELEIELPNIDLIKNKIKNYKYNKIVSTKQESKQDIKMLKENSAEKIIKKIKKKNRAKEKEIEKILKEKEQLEKELIKLKEEKKIIELRELESKKKKLKDNFEETLKKEKIKFNTTHKILEKKWRAESINQVLNSKKKAFNAVKTIKEKSNSNIKLNKNNDLKSVEEVNMRKVLFEELQNLKENKEPKISFKNKNNISIEVKNQNKFEEDEKRISSLERKKALNIISKEELKELEIKKRNNNHSSSKVNLKKYRLVTKK
ncbi:hypothetical protein [Spiroplasma endosymbiont of Atherix ibis]|uniref:hypothetical protein n=1 Tax=Spiroplasma endosymbiont of Atherix ibis TaxID=3066291 RepID=UPI0030D420D8